MSEIPPEYVLGKGHVKFFYPRMKWLKSRFEELVAEMIRRGYNPTYRDSGIFENCPAEFFNDYVPTEKAIELNRQRIADRLNGVK